MKYLVYLTICTENNKIYVGVHKTEDPEVFDGYIGCGVNINVPSSYKKSKTPFQFAVNKYGTKKFKRITLGVFDKKEEAFYLESCIVTEAFIKRNNTYNIKLGGTGDCAEKRKRKIYMYDLDGNFIENFDSAFECAKYINKMAKNGSNVLKALRTGQTLHGFQFSDEKLPFMKKHSPKLGSHNYKLRIGQYKDGVLVKE